MNQVSWKVWLDTLPRLWERSREAATGHPWELAALLLLVVAWIGAASLAAGKAERCRRSPGWHWLLGLLLPFLYPLGVWLFLKPLPPPAPAPEAEPKAAARRRLQIPGKEMAGDTARVSPPGTAPAAAAPGPEPAEAAAAAAEGTFGQPFFQRLKDSGEVTPLSPCFVQLHDSELVVVEVLEALPQVAVVQIRQPEGARQRMRIPYAGIQHLQLTA
ncbi:MAG: hypothetical protein WC789_12770 [Lentisphaeria bacterium]